MRVLAVAAPQRLEGALAAVPTWKEQGVDVVVANWRPVIGPKGWPRRRSPTGKACSAKVAQTDEWKNEVARDGGVSHFMNSRELAAYFDAQYAQFKSILTRSRPGEIARELVSMASSIEWLRRQVHPAGMISTTQEENRNRLAA